MRADAIEQVVMLELRRMAEYLSDDEYAFAELLAKIAPSGWTFYCRFVGYDFAIKGGFM